MLFLLCQLCQLNPQNGIVKNVIKKVGEQTNEPQTIAAIAAMVSVSPCTHDSRSNDTINTSCNLLAITGTMFSEMVQEPDLN